MGRERAETGGDLGVSEGARRKAFALALDVIADPIEYNSLSLKEEGV